MNYIYRYFVFYFCNIDSKYCFSCKQVHECNDLQRKYQKDTFPENFRLLNQYWNNFFIRCLHHLKVKRRRSQLLPREWHRSLAIIINNNIIKVDLNNLAQDIFAGVCVLLIWNNFVGVFFWLFFESLFVNSVLTFPKTESGLRLGF